MKNSPKITWVNHAGYVISFEDINLLVDPWHTGSAFNNGWSLLSKTYFPEELRNKINHIWISHEHPDHFSPKDIMNFKNKNKIKVLFQKTKDKRVLNFLKKKDFKVIEIDNYEKYEINEKFKITIIKNDQIDSMSIIDVDNTKIINTNDCVLDDKKLDTIKKKTLIKNSDILLTQFSYASWIGSPEMSNLRKKASEEKLNQIKSQINYFKPKITIPFASYIYFSHEENKYMNDEITDISKVRDVISENGSKPIFLYPGSTYQLENKLSKFDIDFIKYKRDISNISLNKYSKTNKIDFNDLKTNSNNYLKKIKKKNGSLIMFLVFLLSKISVFIFKKDFLGFSNTKIHLFDLGKNVEFDWIKGLREIKKNHTDYDVEISSESLNYIFLHDWGIGSLMINGRGRYISEYKRWKFNRIFSLGQINSIGKTLITKIFERIISKKVYLLKITRVRF